MICLETLDLSSNALKAVPKTMGYLINLLSLTLANNRIVTLPDAFGAMTSLQSLSLENNVSLEILPRLVGSRGLSRALLSAGWPLYAIAMPGVGGTAADNRFDERLANTHRATEQLGDHPTGDSCGPQPSLP